ncbi:MAG: precorrin-6y C5,15-methyltransferase (decarboxylating) subunit CbiE [Gemmiger sp.]|nr:precorrin-6y C5,15-methyltransferase (decarboxylating) subunit CbiE [Gemmiger sp.]
MQVVLTALGGGCEAGDTLTAEALAALAQADCIVGAARLLKALPAGCTQNRLPATKPEAILEILLGQRGGCGCCAVVYSGDTGFYSGTRGLLPLLEKAGIPARVLPGISSVQLLAARLGRPWQDWARISAHGLACDAVAGVMQGRPAFFLTGGAGGPGGLAAQLVAAGLGGLALTVGENLSYPEERILHGSAEQFAGKEFAPLSVLLAEAAPTLPRRTPGWPDTAFVRGGTPMTKQLVRAAALAKLAVQPTDTTWDVGAGTGSVSVELALAAYAGHTYAVERDPEACALIRQNREKFCAWNLTLTQGHAPEALAALPPPDAVFIGGSGGALGQVVAAVLGANPHARLCIAAITLNTLQAALAALAEAGVAAEVSQLAASHTKTAGGQQLLLANNPVFLIVGNGA